MIQEHNLNRQLRRGGVGWKKYLGVVEWKKKRNWTMTKNGEDEEREVVEPIKSISTSAKSYLTSVIMILLKSKPPPKVEMLLALLLGIGLVSACVLGWF
ncbi:hypothetical protein L1987_01438 [Smallanthus sonchifolius]|uniref:Uncharacterized protein n=1 Tax=Smallanthus sonchifolius TaxID=185202 RepID=A0ACB9K592_9ASTR|nr:hypothetical protein L1987_01438 [Smallanthus sonchifolius]